MKILDEKGKLFGKINVIDLLVIVVIIAVLIGIGVKVLGGDKVDGQAPSSGETENNSDSAASPELFVEAKLTYTVRVTAQHEEVAEQLEKYVDIAQGKKDQLQHGGKLIEDAYVVDFWTEPCRCNILSTGEMEMIGAAEADASGLVDICLVVEAVVPDTITSKVGTLEVRIGKPHLLKTTHMEFINGIVVACEWEPIEE